MLGLLARKKGMTQIFDEAGNMIPVTVVEAGPCTVTEVRTKEKCGYDALQLGFGKTKPQKLTRACMGKFSKKGLSPFSFLREFRTSKASEFGLGQVVNADVFNIGDTVKVQGISKGKGYQGVIKRHGKHGGPGGHGSRFHRGTGSIGQRTSPGEVFKNMKMPGHMGLEKVTIRNLTVAGIDKDNNLLLISGSIPGPNGALVAVFNCEKDFDERVVKLTKTGEVKIEQPQPEQN